MGSALTQIVWSGAGAELFFAKKVEIFYVNMLYLSVLKGSALGAWGIKSNVSAAFVQ